MKIGLFTDFHWGVNKNNYEKVQTGQTVMKNFARSMVDQGVDTIIFCGDWNHSRDYLHVNTQELARKALEEFSEHFKAVHFIVGNHDCHYKDTNDVNSVEQFGRIPNVTVYKEYAEIDLDGKKAGLCPWGFNPKKSNLDVAFGHFDFSGAALVGAVNKGSYTMDKLNTVAPLVFSGHFHIRKEYETKNGKIVTIGDPYEQDWGDVGNPKGFFVLDSETLEYTFCENTFSPKHIPIRWSKIKDFDSSQLNNNYIKVVIDSDYEYDNVVKVAQAFSKAGARSVEMDYQFQKELSIIQDALGDVSMVSHEEAINIYIDGMDIEDEEKAWIRPIAIAMFKEKSE
jgi:DNA repair exonuclease SbcCD nuclease subunit